MSLPRVVYVVTSAGRDLHSSMTRVSAASVRLTNPGCTITLACDSRSATAMKSSDDPLLKEVDEFLSFDTPEGDRVFCNRFIKTSLRNRVDGSFLFLDSDTFVRKKLNGLNLIDCDIAAARNHSASTISEQIWEEDAATVRLMGWQTRNDAYLNGGVMLFQDTPSAHQFAEDWHRMWLDACQITDRYRDQPALNAALANSGVKLAILPDEFNAQIKRRVSIHDAVIWHYYASVNDEPLTAFEALVQRVLSGQGIRTTEIEEMVRSKHPWHSRSMLLKRVKTLVGPSGRARRTKELAQLLLFFSQYVSQFYQELQRPFE
jgi:hypothetical protein